MNEAYIHFTKNDINVCIPDTLMSSPFMRVSCPNGCFQETNLQIFERHVGGLNVNENPLREASALQYLTVNGPHPNVIEVTEVGVAMDTEGEVDSYFNGTR